MCFICDDHSQFWLTNSVLLCRYMVDAADHEKLDGAKNELHSLLDKPQLAGIPVSGTCYTGPQPKLGSHSACRHRASASIEPAHTEPPLLNKTWILCTKTKVVWLIRGWGIDTPLQYNCTLLVVAPWPQTSNWKCLYASWHKFPKPPTVVVVMTSLPILAGALCLFSQLLPPLVSACLHLLLISSMAWRLDFDCPRRRDILIIAFQKGYALSWVLLGQG